MSLLLRFKMIIIAKSTNSTLKSLDTMRYFQEIHTNSRLQGVNIGHFTFWFTAALPMRNSNRRL